MLNFLKYRLAYLIISLTVLVPGIFSLVVWGLKPSIDFTGGTIIEVQISPLRQDSAGQAEFIIKNEEIRSVLQENGIEAVSIQENSEGRLIIKTKPIDRETWESAKKVLDEKLQIDQQNSQNEKANEEATNSAETTSENQEPETQPSTIQEVRFETVGPVLGQELLQKTLIAAIIAVIGILAYVAYAFKDAKFGIAAIIALLHDLLIVVGLFSLFGHFLGVEVDTLFVTAVLTTMSFSVHDTIVVFDRIRESLKKENLPLDITVNKALTETMGRSVNNSMTIVFMLLALILLGGETMKWFVVALLIGTISGTYSSPFVATPVMYFLKKREIREK